MIFWGKNATGRHVICIVFWNRYVLVSLTIPFHNFCSQACADQNIESISSRFAYNQCGIDWFSQS